MLLGPWQVKEDYKYVLHRGTLRSIVGLDKPAGALFDRSIYEFAIHRLLPAAKSCIRQSHYSNPIFLRFR